MVLVRYRCAEQSEDAVSGRLHDVAVITTHGIDHELEDRINDRTRLFGIKILLQPRRVYDVDEKSSDELPLALQHQRGFFCVDLSARALGRHLLLLWLRARCRTRCRISIPVD